MTLLAKFASFQTGFPGGTIVKDLLLMQEIWGQSKESGRPREGQQPTPRELLPGKSLGQRSLTGYLGSQRVGHHLATEHDGQSKVVNSFAALWWSFICLRGDSLAGTPDISWSFQMPFPANKGALSNIVTMITNSQRFPSPLLGPSPKKPFVLAGFL